VTTPSITSSASSTSLRAPPTNTKPATLALLRIQVLRASNLTPKDRNGKSDPFVTVSLPGLAALAAKQQTAVQHKTLDPEWKNESWDFEVTSDWFGTQGWQESMGEEEDDDDEDDEREVGVEDAALAEGAATIELDPESAAQSRPPSRRKLSATASKVLSTSAKGMKLLPKGAAAGARAVARGTPRPMRLGRRSGAVGQRASMPRLGGPAAGLVSNLELVVWDKDFARREYMGEASWPVWEWCRGRDVEWPTASTSADDGIWLTLVSSRRNAKVSGKVQIRLGFVPVPGSPVKSLKRLYRALVTSAVGAGARAASNTMTAPVHAGEEEIRAGVRAIPASQSVGTAEKFFADNGFSSDEEDEEQEELLDTESEDDDELDLDDEDDSETDTDDIASTTDEEGVAGDSDADFMARHKQRLRQGSDDRTASSPSSTPPPEQVPHSATESSADSPLVPAAQRNKKRLLPSFPRRKTGSSGADPAEIAAASESGATTPATDSNRRRVKMPKRRGTKDKGDGTSSSQDRKLRKLQRRLQRRERNREARARKRDAREAQQDYSFKSGSSDIVGIVMMEVKGASDLPRWKNSMRTGFDMDPFTIVAFGQKIFRTRVLRHTLNPTWDEKLLFHVRQHELNYMCKMSIYDWDKLTANDHVGSCELSIAALIGAAPKADPKTGLYDSTDDGLHQMQTFKLPLTRVEKDEDVKYGDSSPSLTFQAKFTPYAALRQRFWRQLCQQFDTNDSESLSFLEVTSMLDSLGSTLTSETISAFFSRFGKSAESGDEITFDEAIVALEDETRKSIDEKRTVQPQSSQQQARQASPSQGLGPEPLDNQDEAGEANMDISGHAPAIRVEDGDGRAPAPVAVADAGEDGQHRENVPSSKPVQLQRTTAKSPSANWSTTASAASSRPRTPHAELSNPISSSAEGDDDSASSPPTTVAQPERVILLKSCPLCHMPRLSKKGDGDVVTHLAVCASQDWRRVDSMVVSNFVTASQAHRKWLNKFVISATQGRYKLGGNSANIIVQDRATGELLEEKMQVYVRLGIRLLYQGARSRMEGARVRKMLKNMSVKQGKKYDSPTSAREIPGFIAFHNLNVEEIRDPLDSFKTFNDFFYRKLKVDARPIEEPKNPKRLVSAADCRLMVFPSVDEATRIWIKGREFSVARLLDVDSIGESYVNGSLCIFRLAPQDYHRFHCPADAVVGEPHFVEGAYYTVNPMAIRSAIDVYGENVRCVVPLHTEAYGTIYYVCIGAMMVGSIVLTVQKGQKLKKGDEVGYYAFGGSTTVCIFEEGRVKWDEDLLTNSKASIETLVRIGSGLGRAVEHGGGEKQ
ncbi:hypothetical protein BDZ90DRAFT_212390, partial [Jaminaea rosea]